VLASLAICLTASAAARTSKVTRKVLHVFSGVPDGRQPQAGLVSDAAGNLYGTTELGGAFNGGTVFELSPSGGGWICNVIHDFPLASGPLAGLIIDRSGNLYGTTSMGGAYFDGSVFELSPAKGGWQFVELYDFAGGSDGAVPMARLVFDRVGNLYGTTSDGGNLGNCPNGGESCGIVFELLHKSGGRWREKVLYTFTGGADGGRPIAEVTLDTHGNVYGTTLFSAGAGPGVVFELSRSGGRWKEIVLHSFAYGTDGQYPHAGMVFDSSGNLYGTTAFGGTDGAGTIFELSFSGGQWQETVIRNFDGADGDNPVATPIVDAAGNLYGTTEYGGVLSACSGLGCGVVFELSGNAKAGWKETVLFKFSNRREGRFPVGGVVFDAAGNLYTTSETGGGPTGAGYGAVLKMSSAAAGHSHPGIGPDN
jgi:uncharacterized repeat protein (TIGR03803 family)